MRVMKNKVKKRKPAELFRIKNIYDIEFKEVYDTVVPDYKGEKVSRIQFYGVVISRFDGDPNKGAFVSLTIDDGHDTIRLKHWPKIYTNTDGSVNDTTKVTAGVKKGDIVDIIGRPQSYEGETYVIPEKISKKSIDWEIFRRSKILEAEMDNFDEFPVESSAPEQTGTGDLDQVILTLFTEVDTLTIDQIVASTQFPEATVREIVNDLASKATLLKTGTDTFMKL